VLAVVFSVLLTLYLIVPEAIFRTIFGYFIPPRNFVLTRTETAYRAVLVTLLPFSLALASSWYLPVVRDWPFPIKHNTVELRRTDYKTVVAGLYSEAEFRQSQKEFWHALTRGIRRQGRLALWYFLFVAFEACLLGRLASDYAKLRSNSVYTWFADRVLFQFISEWHPLLTPYLNLLPGTVVQADILCTNDTLYQGIVSEHFVQDGKLSGIILDQPRRFERKLYLQAKDDAKQGGKPPDKKDYWIPIPSENLYFFADKILNMNLTYLSPAGTLADSTAVKNFIVEVLSRSAGGVGRVTVSVNPEQAPPKA
jgi:hypothetical protein